MSHSRRSVGWRSVVLFGSACIGVALWWMGDELLDLGGGVLGQTSEPPRFLSSGLDAERIGAPDSLSRAVPESTEAPSTSVELNREEAWRKRYPFELGKPIPKPSVLLRPLAAGQSKALLRDLRYYRDVVNPSGIPFDEADAKRIGELVSAEIAKLDGLLLRRNHIQHQAFMSAPPDSQFFKTYEECQAHWDANFDSVIGNIRSDSKGYRCVPLPPSDSTIEIYLLTAEVIAQSSVLAERVRRIIDTGEYQRGR
ncbi:MAG: hypothetical protein JNM84_04805 [Planctomycetes bacterium]|nr:hypothetical protein [Planctomycetota bacterium]